MANANLANANLTGADMANANLAGADMANANLAGAYMANANLAYAKLAGAIGLAIASYAPARLLAVARAALASDDALEMARLHTCSTTHSISGWAEHLGGASATLLYEKMGTGVAGLMLLGIEAHSYFYASNKKARAFLQSVVDNAEASL
jgi:uncharacterized protein YjbI with pentapeptide repeats